MIVYLIFILVIENIRYQSCLSAFNNKTYNNNINYRLEKRNYVYDAQANKLLEYLNSLKYKKKSMN